MTQPMLTAQGKRGKRFHAINVGQELKTTICGCGPCWGSVLGGGTLVN